MLASVQLATRRCPPTRTRPTMVILRCDGLPGRLSAYSSRVIFCPPLSTLLARILWYSWPQLDILASSRSTMARGLIPSSRERSRCSKMAPEGLARRRSSSFSCSTRQSRGRISLARKIRSTFSGAGVAVGRGRGLGVAFALFELFEGALGGLGSWR